MKGLTNKLKMKDTKYVRINSVGSKIFLLFFVSILLFVIILGSVSYNISKNSIIDNSSKGMNQTIVQSTQKLDLLFDLYGKLTTTIISDKDLRADVNIYFSDMSSVEKVNAAVKLGEKLRNNRFTLPGITSTALLTTDTHEMFLDSDNVDTANAAKKIDEKSTWVDEVIKADGDLVWLDTNLTGYASNTNKPVLALARLQKGYYQSGSKPIILVIEISESFITEQLKDVDIGKTGVLQMINKNHQIIQTNNNNDIGKPIHINYLDGKISQNQKAPNGDEVLVISAVSAKTGWSLVGYTTVNELVAQTQKIYRFTVIMAICAIVFAIIVGWFAVRMFGRPLVKLRNIMKVSEAGTLSVRTSFKSNDEIGQLGESFNQMMINFTSLINNTNASAAKVLEMAQILHNSSRATAKSADEIVIVTKDIAEGSSELSSVAERSNILTQQLYEKLSEVISANERMSGIAGDVRINSDKGIAFSKEVIAKTNDTNVLTQEMFEKVNGLRESAASIQKVLELLNNMAKQTNILSLNASIEAARAGAAGKGFMVISHEIRNLADQSKQSIEVVGRITLNIQKDIDDAVNSIEKAYPVFKEQIHMVQETDHIFTKVSGYMGDYTNQLNLVIRYIAELQQSQHALSEAMYHVSATSQESAASTEQVAALSTEQLDTSKHLVSLSEELEMLSEELGKSLSKFSI
ncbi:MAG: hypothetical protein JWM44_4017 [Bacilli bacterium]|nr:hypothetical protein [Bacilli bacterium]